MFQNRQDAGRQLAQKLRAYQHDERCLVLALPRGGVPVGSEIARLLQKRLDVLVVRKIGAPNQPELAVGAIGPGQTVVWNTDILKHLHLQPVQLSNVIQRETVELNRRLEKFRGNRPFPSLQNQTVILVDDGLATGASASVAIQALKTLQPAQVILAVPVGSHSAVDQLNTQVDELICLQTADQFEAVSQYYENFPQNTDTEVIDLLQAHWLQKI